MEIMQDTCNENNISLFIHRTELFDRCLAKLRKKDGAAAMAARKAEEFINGLLHDVSNDGRKKFSYTWNGEHRIRNCKKIDLVGAYRIVLIQKDRRLVFLYIGSHDDCFRWIERNKGLTYEFEQSADIIKISRESPERDELPPDVLEERRFIERHEEEFTRQLDENILLKIFSSWSQGDEKTNKTKGD